MPLNRPTDTAFVLDDGLTAFAPTDAIALAGVLDPATKSANIALSDSNRVASLAAGGAFHLARGSKPIAGEAYFEFTVLGIPNPTDSQTGVGLINATLTNYDTYLTNVNTAGFFSPDNRVGHAPQHATGYGINAGGYTTFLTGQDWAVGTVIGMAVSMSARTAKVTVDGETWSPVFDITALGTTIYPAVGLQSAGDSIRMNGGDRPFVHPVPSGYQGMDAPTNVYYGYGTVAGARKSYDMGAGLTTPSGWLAQFECLEIDKSSGSESYYFVMAGSDDPAFAAYEELSNRWQMSVAGSKPMVAFSTLSKTGVLYRYVEVLKIASGPSPSIKAYCFVAPLGSLTQYTLGELVQIQAFLAANNFEASAQFRRWMTGIAWGGDNHDGVYPLSDGYGSIAYLKSPAQLQAEAFEHAPEYYGAIGDGLTHPASDFYDTLADLQIKYPFAVSLTQELDFLAWQKAINSGFKIRANGNRYKMCNADPDSQQTLVAISGLAWVEATEAHLDFSGMLPKTSDVHYIADYHFALTAGTPWINATTYDPGIHDDAIFGGGEATCIDTRTDGSSPFFQWGQQVTLLPGRYTAICTYTASHGVSYGHGNPTIPYANLSFFGSSPGVGGGVSARYGSSRPNVAAVDATDTVTMTFDFVVNETSTGYFTFTAGGWADWHVTYMDIVPALLNCAVLMTRDGAPSYYPIMRPLAGLWIEAPDFADGITGVLWKSFESTDGNVLSLRSCNVTGFTFGAEASDGGYLQEIENVNLFGNYAGFHHRPGSFNAGENIRFRGGGIYNNAIGIDNDGGADINLVNTAIDYNTQAIVNNTGFVTVSQTRIEQWADSRGTLPIFHCKSGGRISCSQVRFLGAGTPGTMIVPPVQLDSALSAMTWDNCDIYNLSSATGFASSGPGMLRITNFQKMGNPWIGPLGLSPNPNMDVLAGAGFFEPLPYLWPGMPADEICLEGAVWPHPTHTFTDRWTSEFTTVSLSTDYAYTGTRSLKVSRAVSADYSRNDSLNLLIPTKGGHIMGEFRVLFPNDTVPYDLMRIYFREWWVKVNGYDAYGRPIYGPKLLFAGETDIEVPETGSLTWIQRGIGTLYSDDTPDAAAEKGICPPTWATHLLLMLDHQSVPAMDYYIDGLWANEIG